jgi:hypothetical protein
MEKIMKFRVPFLQNKDTQSSLVVLLAALHPDQTVIETLSNQSDITLREAYSIRGAMQALPGVHLVILDELMTFPDAPMEVLHRTLEMNHIPVVSQNDFLSASEDWLGQARLTNSRQIAYLPARQINLMNWSGGVGKTTLAMAICKRFVKRTGLPAALLELGMGGSVLQAKISQDLPEFFSLMTHKNDPGKWNGVNIYPMDGRAFEVLWADDPDGVRSFLGKIRQNHTLLVVDCFPGHPLFSETSTPGSELFNLIVSSPRNDSLLQARRLMNEIPNPSYLVLNMAKSMSDRTEPGVSIALPYNETWAQSMAPQLADPLLEIVYEGWKGINS